MSGVQPSLSENGASPPVSQDDAIRRCVACRYDLFGLGDEPRCPECGLINVPDAFRQEVWKLVDSGRWFFSNIFRPFQKRPPGWWWSLDRENDLTRSIKFAAAHVLVTAVLILCAGMVGSVFRVEQTWSYAYPVPRTGSQPTINSLARVYVIGLGGEIVRFDERVVQIATSTISPTAYGWQCRSARILMEPPPWSAVWTCGGVILWTLLSWFTVATVGLWTQIRRGLPRFANAPRTIIAASNYESHRMEYVALLFLLGVVLEGSLRLTVFRFNPPWNGYPLHFLALWGPIGTLAAIGWVGPLRSDYTRQLIRSRAHAGRVILMYAVAFPILLTGAIAVLVSMTFLNS